MSHDQNFKNLIVDYPRDSIGFFAADEAGEVDRHARIVAIREEQLVPKLGERFRELDVPLLVEWPDGRREAILFVFEEQTEGRRFSIHRLAHYCLDLAELYGTERVVPVVIFLRAGGRPHELTLGGDRHRYLAFRYLACALFDLDWLDWRDSDNLVARLNLPNMRYDAADRVDVYAHALRGLLALEPDPEKQLKYIDFVEIYSSLTEAERARYRQRYPEESQAMTSFQSRFEQLGMERGMRKGMQEGLQQGIQQGIQRGEANILLHLLEQKFGPVDPALRQRVEQADADTLLRWSSRVLAAEAIEQVMQ